jgi:hypothetical protein
VSQGERRATAEEEEEEEEVGARCPVGTSRVFRVREQGPGRRRGLAHHGWEDGGQSRGAAVLARVHRVHAALQYHAGHEGLLRPALRRPARESCLLPKGVLPEAREGKSRLGVTRSAGGRDGRGGRRGV